MLGLKPMELLLILFALLLLFGATRLPALGSSLGSAIRNFKKGFGGEGEESTAAANGEKKGGTLASGAAVDKDVSAKAQTPSHHG